ncbi:putative peptidoglycan glycosyltransferase FtsW [Novosphingobium sp. TH158]|uniref:peptidoglycan glycosyltransferase FtsW n=1 Tax=Novosphingobium sp. TH158 TaxID=2067455 RepID=UPI000C7B9930|nr:putative peptidoglycan glycosyltransferase FtsW [Novosphingobium sp. TH158]PLK26396.1 cell division protein FtsW [Novosphingobium sp. TH158]
MASNPPFVPRSGLASAGQRRRSKWQEVAIWWREIDRVTLVLVLALMALGAAAVAAASPASARKLSTAQVKLEDLHFFWLQLRVQFAGILVMLGASFMSKEWARRVGIVLGAAMLVGLVLVLVPGIGHSVKGARRWVNLGVGSLQPSEFLKPAYAILMAWILSWKLRDPQIPVIPITAGLMLLVSALLMAEPDFGSTVLFVGVWFVLVTLSGMDMKKISVLIGAGVAGIVATYFLYDNARHRIDNFLGGGTAYDQVDLAHKTLTAGGWTGNGLWLGMRKLSLPEAHTDYIFSVIGEEFGLLFCLLIVILYLTLVVRVLLRLIDEEDLFTLLAGAGLAVQIGGQAFINVLVNLGLFPSKGMTLPLISYGGSSTLALCFGIGLMLAITRRNPFLRREPFNLFRSETHK